MDDIKPNFCPNCGKGTARSATFCASCGQRLLAKQVHRPQHAALAHKQPTPVTHETAVEHQAKHAPKMQSKAFNTRKVGLIWFTACSIIFTLLFLASSDGAEGDVGVAIFAGIFLGALIGVLGTIIQKHFHLKKHPVQVQEVDEIDPVRDEKLTGIGGWLAFFTAGQIITVFIVGFGLYELFSLYSSVVGTQYSSVINFEILANCIYLGLILWALTLIIQRKKLAVKVVTLLLSFALFVTVADGIWAASIRSEQTTETETTNNASTDSAGRNIWLALLWIPYFHKSRRVKLTLTK